MEDYVSQIHHFKGFMKPEDAKGFGALEHPTSTTVVMPEMMGLEMLQEQLKDVVSHEFFHIVTPLTVHSNEIQYFDFNNPQMSEHLWMYEGVTEYFANLFQVNQGLISEQEFLNKINEKINASSNFDDTMPFTKMSKNILEPAYARNYGNVYQKGALIGMCIEPGDMVKLPNNDIVTITRVEPTQDGYDLFFLDLFEDDELCYSLSDNDSVSLLQFD